MKHQTGIRIDKIIYDQFQQICKTQKLRPGEAVESLMRLAVQAGSVTSVSIDSAKSENPVRMFDDALFKSRLARLKKSLELEENFLKETGELPEEPDSGNLVAELTQLGRRSISKELVQEFETCLTRADKLYEDAEKARIQQETKRLFG